MKFLNSLRAKFLFICFLLLAVPSLIIGIIGYQISKQELENAGKLELKDSVHMTIGMINILNKEVKAGHLTLLEAQEELRQEIFGRKQADNNRPINQRYIIGKSGYLFAINKNAISVMHPSMEGQDLTNIKTEDGLMLG